MHPCTFICDLLNLFAPVFLSEYYTFFQSTPMTSIYVIDPSTSLHCSHLYSYKYYPLYCTLHFLCNQPLSSCLLLIFTPFPDSFSVDHLQPHDVCINITICSATKRGYTRIYLHMPETLSGAFLRNAYFDFVKTSQNKFLVCELCR